MTQRFILAEREHEAKIVQTLSKPLLFACVADTMVSAIPLKILESEPALPFLRQFILDYSPLGWPCRFKTRKLPSKSDNPLAQRANAFIVLTVCFQENKVFTEFGTQ